MLLRCLAYLPPVILLVWAWLLPDRWRSGQTEVPFRERLIEVALWWIRALVVWLIWRGIRRLSRRPPQAVRGFEVLMLSDGSEPPE